MKFLVISSFKDTLSTLPPSVVRQSLEATVDVLKQDMKAGKILEFYIIPGQNRGVSIQERKSAEELMQAFSATPIAAFANFEIYPLADFNEAMKTMIESLKAAEKIMPVPPK